MTTPLKWKETRIVSTDDNNGPLEGVRVSLTAWKASPYLIVRHSHIDGLFILAGTRDGHGHTFPSLKKAMAAAQADYDAKNPAPAPHDATPRYTTQRLQLEKRRATNFGLELAAQWHESEVKRLPAGNARKRAIHQISAAAIRSMKIDEAAP